MIEAFAIFGLFLSIQIPIAIWQRRWIRRIWLEEEQFRRQLEKIFDS